MAVSLPDRWSRFSWYLLALTSTIYALAGNQADNDLWVHLLTGKRIIAGGTVPRVDDWSYTAAGVAWYDHEWLTQTAFAWVFSHGGDTGLWLLKIGVGLLAAFFVWRQIAVRTERVWVRGPVMVLTMAVLGRGFAIRPQIATYLGIAWLLWWLDAEGKAGDQRSEVRGQRTIQILLPALVLMVWANAHGGFVVGLAILLLYAAIPPRGDAWRWGTVAAAAVAVCVNPYGPSLLGYIANELRVPHPSTEWLPVSISDPAQGPFFALIAVVLLTIPFARTLRHEPWRAFLLAGFTWMALRHQRHTPVFALLAAAPLADQLDAAAAWWSSKRPLELSPWSITVIHFAAGLIAAVQIGFLSLRLVGDRCHIVFEAREYPVAAVEYLKRQGLSGNVAVPLDWGAYVLWHASPDVKVSLDGRFATIYPADVVTANFDFFGGRNADLTARYPTSMVLAPAGAPVPVRDSNAWQLRYHDDVADLYTPAHAGQVAIGQAPRGHSRFP